MTNKSQKDRVKYKLLHDLFITRNECLRQIPAITRLSAIIQILEDEGWEFKTNRTEADYKYTVKKAPYRNVEYTTADGRKINRLEKI